MAENTCDVCTAECTSGVGLTTHYQDLRGKWQRQRMCKLCAKSLGELEDERAVRAIEQAERSGV